MELSFGGVSLEVAVSVQEVSSSQRRLTLEVPADIVSSEFHRAYADIQRRASLPGFRPGKVPLALIQAKFKKAAEEDVVEHLLKSAYRQAITNTHLEPIALPVFSEVAPPDPNKKMVFHVLVEVVPVIGPLQYQGLPISSAEVTIDESDIDAALRTMQETQGQLQVCPDDHVVAPSNYLVIDYTIRESVPPVSGRRQMGEMIQVGVGKLPPEIEEALLGKQRGAHLQVSVPMPSGQGEATGPRHTVHYDIVIQEVKAHIAPALDDDFAKDNKFQTLSALREHLRGVLLEEARKKQVQLQKDRLLNDLLDLHPVTPPPSWTEREIHHMMHQMGVSDFHAEKQAQLYELVRPEAVRRVAKSLVLHAIAEREGVHVSEQEWDLEMSHIANRARVPLSEVTKRFNQDKTARDEYREQMRVRKAIDRVYELARFEPSTGRVGPVSG